MKDSERGAVSMTQETTEIIGDAALEITENDVLSSLYMGFLEKGPLMAPIINLVDLCLFGCVMIFSNSSTIIETL